MAEYNDEFFVNLVMKLSEKDQDVYNKWAVWCDDSKHQYYISSRCVNGDIEYFTVERPALEVRSLRRIDAIHENIDSLNLDMDDPVNQEYVALAEQFIAEGLTLRQDFIPYEQFIAAKRPASQQADTSPES